MPVFTLQAPDGRKVKIEAADQATAMRGAQEWYASQQPRSPNVGKDVAKSGGSGVARGVAGIADTVIAALPQARAITGGIDAFNAATGGKPQIRGAGPATPVSDLYNRFTHKPETRAGRYAEAVGEMAPNALAPGGVARRAAAVVLPGVAGEGAREGVQAMGGNQLAQAAAQFGGNLLGGAAAAVRTVPKLPAPKPKGPASPLPGLTAERKAAYEAVKQSGHRYSPEDFSGMVENIKGRLAKEQYDPDFHEPARKMVAKLEAKVARGEGPTLAELDKLRSFARKNVEKVGDKEQRRVGGVIGRGIDEFIDAQGGEASALVGKARGLYKREQKVAEVTRALQKGERQARKSGSGGNYDNATRQRMDSILEKNPYLSADERAALENIVMGDRGQNALRAYGKTSPLSGGLSAQVNALGAIGTLGAGAVLHSIPSSAAKIAADNITRQKVKRLIDLMAAGGSREDLLAAQRQAGQIKGPAGAALRKIIAKQLRQIPVREGALVAATAASAARAEANQETR
jgi:hypothetical protein